MLHGPTAKGRPPPTGTEPTDYLRARYTAFADVARSNLRPLLSGPGGCNRIHLIVEDIKAEAARLRAAGVPFRNAILAGPH